MSVDFHFLDVGHGDCTLIDFPDRLTVVDINNCTILAKESEDELRKRYAPPQPNPFLAGRFGQVSSLGSAGLAGIARPSLVMDQLVAAQKLKEAKDRLTNPIDYLKAKFAGREIFRYIQTHPDMDHMAGLYRLREEGIGIVNLWDTKHCIEKDEDALRHANVNKDIKDWYIYQALRKSDDNPKVLQLTAGATGDYYTADGIEIWAPFDHRHEANPAADPNALSYVLFIRVGKCNIVLGGDATIEMWEEIYKRRNGQFPKVHLLKASHHGRKSGYHMQSVRAMSPDVTILSVGELKAKDDAAASYERFSIKGCHSTVDHADIIATCWQDSEVWLKDRAGNVFLRSFS
jgi:competence protein ComEC